MSRRNQTEKTPWHRLKRYKPPYYKSMVIWIISSMVLAVVASFLLNHFVQFEADEPEIIEVPVEPEQLNIIINYPSQIVRDDFDQVFVEVVLFNQDGPVIGEKISFKYENFENGGAGLVTYTDYSGSASLALEIPSNIFSESLKGSVSVRDMHIPVRIFIGQGRAEFVQNPDGDGLPDIDETCIGIDDINSDTDGDGLSNSDEFCKWKTDPLISNRKTINVAAAKSLSVYADVEDLPVIFMIEGEKTFDFVWVRQDDLTYYGFFEGYIGSGLYDRENQIIPTGTTVFNNAELAEQLMIIVEDVRYFEFIDPIAGDMNNVDILKIRVFIRINKQDIETVETVIEP